MNLSVFLAQVIGIYMVILGISLFSNGKHFSLIMLGLINNAESQFIMGTLLLALGVTLVVLHNVWEMSWVVVITIIAWMIFIKGIVYTVIPRIVLALAEPYIHATGLYYFVGVMDIGVGLFLCFKGFLA